MQLHLENQVRGGVFAQCDFRTIHSEHAGITTGSTAGSRDAGSRKKTKLHEPVREIIRQVDTLDNPGLAFAQIGELPDYAGGVLEGSLDTQLHLRI